jgi:hypothetical protein
MAWPSDVVGDPDNGESTDFRMYRRSDVCKHDLAQRLGVGQNGRPLARTILYQCVPVICASSSCLTSLSTASRHPKVPRLRADELKGIRDLQAPQTNRFTDRPSYNSTNSGPHFLEQMLVTASMKT